MRWEAWTQNLDGTPITAENVEVKAGDSSSTTSPQLDPTTAQADVPGNGNLFILNVGQTRATHILNVARVALDVAALLIGQVSDKALGETADSCLSPFYGQLVSADGLTDFASSTDGSGLLTALGMIFSPENLPEFGKLAASLASCATGVVLTTENTRLLGPLGKMVGQMVGELASGGKIIFFAYDLASLATDMANTYLIWGDSTSVVVCEAANFHSNVTNCPAHYVLSPNPIALTAGSAISTTVSATDIKGNNAAVPINLVWQTSDSNIATVDLGGIVHGIAPGSAIISFADPLTGAPITATVNVVPANLPHTQADVTVTGTMLPGPVSTDYLGVFLDPSSVGSPPFGNLGGLPYTLVFHINVSNGKLTTPYKYHHWGARFNNTAWSATGGSALSADLTIQNHTVHFDYSSAYPAGSNGSVAQIGYELPSQSSSVLYSIQGGMDNQHFMSAYVTLGNTVGKPPITTDPDLLAAYTHNAISSDVAGGSFTVSCPANRPRVADYCASGDFVIQSIQAVPK